MRAPTILGVRHHSPACARLVAHTLRALRPAMVLVEGPSEMNDRLEELFLGHTLPIAFLTFRRRRDEFDVWWRPLTEHSPEWVALQVAREVGAELRFFDRPAWAGDSSASSDGPFPSEGVDAICRALGEPDFDFLWEHLFEGPEDPEALAPRLERFFAELRSVSAIGPEILARERFMREALGWALEAAGGPVVVVCGGLHAPALADPPRAAAWPQVPVPGEGVEVGTFLVPCETRQLAGPGTLGRIPAPAFYRALWEVGPEAAPERMLAKVRSRLRSMKPPVSTAALIQVRVAAEGLARLRGHRTVSRLDLLDGLASGLLDEALEAPLPWSPGGAGRPPSSEALRRALEAFVDIEPGALAEGTPRPPLQAAVLATLDAQGLAPPEAGRRKLRLDLVDPEDRARSRTLRRLEILQIPGFIRISGAPSATSPALEETWSLWRARGLETSLARASVYGGDLDTASIARLVDRVRARRDAVEVAEDLETAVAAGLVPWSGPMRAPAVATIGRERSLDRLGRALRRMLDLRSTGGPWPVLEAAIEAAIERGLQLAEGVRGPSAALQEEQVEAMAALRDALLARPGDDTRRQASVGAAGRIWRDEEAPPALRGAALGLAWSAELIDDEEAAAAVRGLLPRFRRPQALGDFVGGLAALAREQMVRSQALLGAFSAMLDRMDEASFRKALPALRMAFEFFPPLEKAALARCLAGQDPGMDGPIASDASVRDAGRQIEAAAAALARRVGLRAPALREASGGGKDRGGGMASGGAGSAGRSAHCAGPEGRAAGSAGAAEGVAGGASEAGSGAGLSARAAARWRLALGEAAEGALPRLGGEAGEVDRTLSWLYDRDPDLARRGIRRRGGGSSEGLEVQQWLETIRRLFPEESVERLELDAIERYRVSEIVTNPRTLERLAPNPRVAAAILRSVSLMGPEALSLARTLVDRVVEELRRRVAKEVDEAFGRHRDRVRRVRRGSARALDARRTIRRNLAYYQRGLGRLVVRRPVFFAQGRRRVPWQVIILLDLSGSMASSLVHAVVLASCLRGLPALRTHLCAFDTRVVDLSDETGDPLELLFGLRLGGGTDIANALDYAESIIETPQRSIAIVVSDFFEGGRPERLVRRVTTLVQDGVRVLGVVGLDPEEGASYDERMARALSGVGARIAALTPGALAEWLEREIRR